MERTLFFAQRQKVKTLIARTQSPHLSSLRRIIITISISLQIVMENDNMSLPIIYLIDAKDYSSNPGVCRLSSTEIRFQDRTRILLLFKCSVL